MKYLFFYIVCFLTLFNGSAGALQAPQFPDDFEGKDTRQFWANALQDENYEITFTQNLNVLYEIGSYLYKKYSWEEIQSENFIEKIRPFFPEDTDEGLRKKQTYLINTASLYKKGKEMYVEILNKYLVPHAYRKVHDASEYDHPGEVSYIPTTDDKYVKVYNFKKFLSYSSNFDELNAISDFERKNGNSGIMAQIELAIEKIDWKKVWFYGTLYDNPLLSKLGRGDIMRGNGVNIRLLSRDKYTNRKKQLDYGLQIIVHHRYFVLANNLSEDQLKPQINFNHSQNVAEAEILYPMPQKVGILPQAHKYFGNFMIPIKVTPLNPDENIDLVADGKLTLCDAKLNCHPQPFEVKIHTDVSGDDQLHNPLDSVFFGVLNNIPTNKSKHLKFKQFTAIESPNGPELQLKMTTDKRVKSIEAYIEDNEGFTPFAEPNYSLNKDGFDVYFKPISADKDINLSNTEYTVSIHLNDKYSYRDNIVPGTITTDIEKNTTTVFGAISTSIMSGIILNFTPCCAPLILLLLLLFIRIFKINPAILHSLQMSTLKGSAIGILVVTLLFGSSKLGDNYMLWGMQFSCLPMLCCLLFIFATLLILLSEISSLLTKITTSNRHSDIFFALGIIIGALSYVGAAPYLSRLMNISKASTGLLSLTISIGLTIGFIALQYLMIRLPDRKELWQTLGNNQKIILKYMRIALYITLFWLLLFIGFQCSFMRTLTLVGTILIWMYLCMIYGKYTEYLNINVWDESITPQHLQKIRLGYTAIMSLLLAAFIITGIKITGRIKTDLQAAATDDTKIEDLVRQNKIVLVIADADWCFKCQISKHWTVNSLIRKRWQKHNNMEIIYEKNLDKIKQYMQQYNQFSLPFYIMYTANYPHGIVLSSDAEENDFVSLLNNN